MVAIRYNSEYPTKIRPVFTVFRTVLSFLSHMESAVSVRNIVHIPQKNELKARSSFLGQIFQNLTTFCWILYKNTTKIVAKYEHPLMTS